MLVKSGKENAPPGKWVGLRIQQKLKSLKDQLKIWNKTTFTNVSQIKDELLQKIQDLDDKEALKSLTNLLRGERS